MFVEKTKSIKQFKIIFIFIWFLKLNIKIYEMKS